MELQFFFNFQEDGSLLELPDKPVLSKQAKLVEHPLFRHILGPGPSPLKDGPYLLSNFASESNYLTVILKGIHGHSSSLLNLTNSPVHPSVCHPILLHLARPHQITPNHTKSHQIHHWPLLPGTKTARSDNSLATHPTRLLLQLLNTHNPIDNHLHSFFIPIFPFRNLAPGLYSVLQSPPTRQKLHNPNSKCLQLLNNRQTWRRSAQPFDRFGIR